MMFGDESAAAGEPERFSAGSGESIDDLLSRLGMAGAGGAAGGGGRAASFGAARPQGKVGARNEPIEVTAELTLEESFHGTTPDRRASTAGASR